MNQSHWDSVKNTEFVLRIFVCGYEKRACFVAERQRAGAAHTLILDYQCEGTINYDYNRRFFVDIVGAEFIPIDGNLGEVLSTRLVDIAASLDNARDMQVLFDVSSCSRSVMATVLLTLAKLPKGVACVTCTYALSAFDAPPEGELPSHISQPVVGDLSGWSDDLSKPPCAVIGLGFEPGRALGCMDYLEIPEVRLFMPLGADKRFEKAVRAANAVLIEEAGHADVLPYDVLDPSSTYQKLESLVHGLLPAFRPVLIPLGPKILAALSIILAIKLYPRVCVWRTSAGSGAEINDRRASGEIAVFTTSVGPTPVGWVC